MKHYRNKFFYLYPFGSKTSQLQNHQNSRSLKTHILTLNQPPTHKCVQSLHKSIIIYMGAIILGANLFKQIPMASKGF